MKFLRSLSLILSIPFLFCACNQQGGDLATPSEVKLPVEPNGPSANSLKIAYIQNDSLAENYLLLQDKLKDLQSKLELAEERLQTKAVRLQGEITDFQKKAQNGMLSRNDIRKEEERLQKKQVELQREQQQQSQSLMLEEAKVKEEVYLQIKNFLSEYVDYQGYDFVLGYQPGSTIWYAKDHLDITEEILVALNEAYEAEKK
jgi:outer membrane protein